MSLENILRDSISDAACVAIRNVTPEQAKAIRQKRERDLEMANVALARFWHWRAAVKARLRPKWWVD